MIFTITGAVRSKKNSMRIVTNPRTGKPFPIQSKAQCTWAKSAVLQLKSQWGGKEPLLVPVRMTATLYCERRGADMLNLLAAVSDALEAAGIIANDRQVVSVDGSRMLKDAERPRVEVEVEAIP